MKTLNEDQDETFFVYLNGRNKDPATLKRFTKCSSKPRKLCFAINVCKNETGQTFIGCDFQSGNHWNLCHVDTTTKKIVYGDSLGWAIPANLLNKLDRYIKAINVNLNVTEFTVSTTHNPNSKSPIRGWHKCNHTCAKNYPLQTCSNICGIVVMVMAALACYHKELFQNMTAMHPPAKVFPRIFLSNPSRFGKYLRMVIGSWITNNSVNVLHVLPQFWHRSTQSNKPKQRHNNPTIKKQYRY